VDATEWDGRYGNSELLWGADPNRFVAAELQDATPGRALDVACGEGRNAIWLAARGWEAVGVDFSRVALERAAELAERAGVANRVRWVTADVVEDPLPTGPFDAVVVAYLHLPAPARQKVVAAAAGELSAGGRLVVVGHDLTNLTEGVGGPQDPTVLFTPDDVVDDLHTLTDVTIERSERVRRTVPTPEGERQAVDALVVARRSG
jgi:SAM-dependent methyltransferase